MTPDFSSAHGGPREVAQYFSSAEKKEPRIPSEKISFTNERGIKRICHQQAFPKSMAKGSSLNRKEMMKEEGSLEHQEGRKNMERAKI